MSKLSVILGSTRQERMGARVATWVMQYAPDAELLDLKVINLPFYDESKTPDELQGKYSNQIAQLWHDKIVTTKQLVFVTPEYNHSYPGVLKNAIDYMFNDWKGEINIPFVDKTFSPDGVASDEKLTNRLQTFLNNFSHE